MKLKQALSTLKQAASDWSEDRAPSMGAALSYYTVFSIAPLLLIVIAVAGLVFGMDAARGAIVDQLQGLLGESTAKTIQSALQSVSEPKQGALATVIGVLLLLLGATTVFAELQDDLNRIWKAPAQAKPSGLWGWVRARVLSFGMILGIGFLLLVSLVASAAISALGHWWSPFFGGWEVLAQAVNFVLSLALVTAMFALIYRFMPSVKVQWHDVWIGAAVTALLFTIGKFAIGLYIGKSSVTSGFGAAGSLAVLLLWVYYSAQIFLLGAEFTHVYAQTVGSHQGQAPGAKDKAKEKSALAAPYPRPQTIAAAAKSTTPAVRKRVNRAAPAQPARAMGKAATAIQRHLLPAVGAAAALGALSAWAFQRMRPSRPALRRPPASAASRPVVVVPPDTPTANQPSVASSAAKQIAQGLAKGATAAVMHAVSGAAMRGFKRGMPSST